MKPQIYVWAEAPANGNEYGLDDLKNLEGEATYMGSATGYAHHLDRAGEITAKVLLEATFGTGTRYNKPNPQINGDVYEFEFKDDSESNLLAKWSAGLHASLDEDGNPDFSVIDHSDEGYTPLNKKGSHWDAIAYTTGTGTPTNLVGWFDVYFVDGATVGAFDIEQYTPKNNQ
ncbi:MAG: hypothetical protein OXH65_00690 [Paracoccaceae bacterium]|nr:hypothetical protein [Paracoccaceae bacterium]MDE2673607.1 hypothetical protein [Paracoccaceae bacterium]MDE2739852.1 hypothetical protein [Paracoccaceae bacterium]